MSAVGAVVGAGLSYWGNRKARKQQEEAQRRWMDFLTSSPAWKAQQQTLAYLSPQLGKGSPMLKLQYGRGREDITRAGERSVRRSRTYWGREGNVGRARGEEQRSRLATSEALGGLSLGYGSAQEQHKLGIAQMLAGVGQGMSPLVTAGGESFLGLGRTQGRLTEDTVMDLSGYLGDLVAWWTEQRKKRSAAGGAGAAGGVQ